jgi:cation:H+ antiporter
MPDVALMVIGVLAAAGGGEFFVRGSVRLAAAMRVPAGIIAATVAAFATSTPELSVALNAATTGQPEIPLGDAVGSNVANIGLILGLALIIVPLAAHREDIRRDLPFALAAPSATGLLLYDGALGRVDGAILIGLFVAWLGITLIEARRVRAATAAVFGDTGLGSALTYAAIGMVLLVVAGRLIVVAAKGFGEELGIDPFVVGATLVAFGTSAPELATTLVAGLRGHAEVALGTLLGSNIFNNLGIVGVTAIIEPIHPSGTEVAVALTASAIVLLAVVPGSAGRLGHRRGVSLVAAYAAYVGALLALT